MILSTAYFPPVSWLALAARDMRVTPRATLPHPGRGLPHLGLDSPHPGLDPGSPVLLEANENYQKQSYRNRCYILAADGPQMLQVPVVHGDSRTIRDVLVDYSTPWVLRTQRALDTAYETAAYYEYYRDGVFALLGAKPRTLWELNLSTIRFLLEKTGVACKLEPTTGFAATGTVEEDYRHVIHPKHPDTVLEDLGLARPYYQVFRDRLGGFTPRLSCLDLLFNEGPASLEWVKR